MPLVEHIEVNQAGVYEGRTFWSKEPGIYARKGLQTPHAGAYSQRIAPSSLSRIAAEVPFLEIQ